MNSFHLVVFNKIIIMTIDNPSLYASFQNLIKEIHESPIVFFVKNVSSNRKQRWMGYFVIFWGHIIAMKVKRQKTTWICWSLLPCTLKSQVKYVNEIFHFAHENSMLLILLSCNAIYEKVDLESKINIVIGIQTILSLYAK